jgi:hypothetical protein
MRGEEPTIRNGERGAGGGIATCGVGYGEAWKMPSASKGAARGALHALHGRQVEALWWGWTGLFVGMDVSGFTVDVRWGWDDFLMRFLVGHDL